MLIKEIEPIDKWGMNLLKEDNRETIIEKIIELPLQEACKIFARKGIQTVMSSANKNNVLKPGEKPKEKADVYGSGQQFFYPSPTFEDAGKGYAWIMLDFESLSDENKNLLFSLEERKDSNGCAVGEKAIWFVHPYRMGNLDFQIKVGRYSHDDLRTMLTEDEFADFKDIKYDEQLAEFEKRSIVLSYNDRYPSEVVILRMPINEQTTVDEVQEYFLKFAETFKSQQRNKIENGLNRKPEDEKTH